MVDKFKRWVWALMAAPFFGAFAAHPCLEHLGVVLLGVGIAALGIRKQHCCTKDHGSNVDKWAEFVSSTKAEERG